jgi:hypothetical protein
MEGDVHRCQPFLGYEPAQAGLQGRHDPGGGKEFVFEDDEQDNGLNEAWF